MTVPFLADFQLMRFYDPTAGTISLDGVPLRALNLRSLHHSMGLVAQDTQLFGSTVEENIACEAETATILLTVNLCRNPLFLRCHDA